MLVWFCIACCVSLLACDVSCLLACSCLLWSPVCNSECCCSVPARSLADSERFQHVMSPDVSSAAGCSEANLHLTLSESTKGAGWCCTYITTVLISFYRRKPPLSAAYTQCFFNCSGCLIAAVH